MGEAELGRIDIPMRDKSVKKSFQTFHRISPFLTYSPEINLKNVMRLVVKLFASKVRTSLLETVSTVRGSGWVMRSHS
jgi:hypothetical protein